jgi:hypothetical protein
MSSSKARSIADVCKLLDKGDNDAAFPIQKEEGERPANATRRMRRRRQAFTPDPSSAKALLFGYFVVWTVFAVAVIFVLSLITRVAVTIVLVTRSRASRSEQRRKANIA